MSEIANALKKIKQSERKVSFSYGAVKKVTSLSSKKIYLLVFLISLMAIFFYFYFTAPVFKQKDKYNINVQDDINIFRAKLAEYDKMKKENINSSFYSALVKNDFDTAQKLISQTAKDEDKKRYEAILSFAKNDYMTAKSILEDLIKVKKDFTAINLLSYIYYSYGDYVKASNILLKEEIDDGNIYLNKAILYEKTGNIKEALNYYEKGLSLLNSDFIKYKVKIKIMSMKMATGIQ